MDNSKQEATYVFPDDARRRQQRKCCGKKCCVIALVVVLLFITFVALPAGIMLIVHGRNKGSLWRQVGGAIIVCLPIIASIIIAAVICARRRMQRMGQNTVATVQRI